MTSTKVIIREAQSEDAQGVLNYLKFITNETSNLLLTPEEMAQKKLTDEINLLEESSKSSANLFLLAGYPKGEIAGKISFSFMSNAFLKLFRLNVPPSQHVPIPKEVRYKISFSNSYPSASIANSLFSTVAPMKLTAPFMTPYVPSFSELDDSPTSRSEKLTLTEKGFESVSMNLLILSRVIRDIGWSEYVRTLCLFRIVSSIENSKFINAS